ncbi:hypothetical protein BLK80_004189 [Salmonella enterica subsp. enterica serovar Mbandaka]|nr:hypothetical protein [Salmonella enterica subsp. enterica serovar Mbandaka]
MPVICSTEYWSPRRWSLPAFSHAVAHRRESRRHDAPRDKCAHFREINGIAAAFQYLQKNYNPTASTFLWPSTGKYR